MASMASVKYYLKVYSICLGFLTSFAAFLWLGIVLFALSQTDPHSKDLLMARYLDASFGLLAFTSSLALVYGAFVESKTWLSVWTLGSATVLVGYWTFFFYRKYGVASPESLEQTQTSMLCFTAAYVLTILPVLKYYKLLESSDSFLKTCKRTSQAQAYQQQQQQGRQRKYKTREGFCISVPIEEDLYNPV